MPAHHHCLLVLVTITATDGARVSTDAQCGDKRQHSQPTWPANDNPPPLAPTGTGGIRLKRVPAYSGSPTT